MTARGAADGVPVHLGSCNGVAGSAVSPVWTAFEFNDLKGFGSADGIAEQRGCRFPASHCATVKNGTLVVAHSCSATDAATFDIELC